MTHSTIDTSLPEENSKETLVFSGELSAIYKDISLKAEYVFENNCLTIRTLEPYKVTHTLVKPQNKIFLRNYWKAQKSDTVQQFMLAYIEDLYDTIEYLRRNKDFIFRHLRSMEKAVNHSALDGMLLLALEDYKCLQASKAAFLNKSKHETYSRFVEETKETKSRIMGTINYCFSGHVENYNNDYDLPSFWKVLDEDNFRFPKEKVRDSKPQSNRDFVESIFWRNEKALAKKMLNKMNGFSLSCFLQILDLPD